MKGLELLRPQLADYELIDCGDGAKLERFGERVVARPEPQAIWRRTLPAEEWERLADATFRRDGQSEERGQWAAKPGVPERWVMRYDRGGMHLRMRLALTGFKHVGVFPEQAENWNFIYDEVRARRGSGSGSGAGLAGGSGSGVSVLNLFAYTGGATLAARSAGADVTHVDAVKQTVAWARDNLEISGLGDAAGSGSVRWIVDDALKFVRREVRRDRLYDGIILDPPAYGRGPDGEKWVLEQGLDEMLELCAKLLKPSGFLVLNLYSMGLSALLARTAVHRHFGVPEGGSGGGSEGIAEGVAAGSEDVLKSGSGGVSESFLRGERFGELYFSDRAGKDLPLGVYYRFSR